MSKDNTIKKNKKKPWKIVLDVVFYTFIGLLLVYFVCNTIDIKSGYNFPFLGVRHTVITSPSMSYVDESNYDRVNPKSERIQVNDVVVSHLYKSYEEVKVGDVIIFAGSGVLICHRVKDKYEDNGKKYIVTRGDANSADDQPITFSLVKGKVTRVIPKLGGFLLFVQSFYFLIAVFGSIFFISLGLFIADYHKKGKKAEANNGEVIDQKPEETNKKE